MTCPNNEYTVVFIIGKIAAKINNIMLLFLTSKLARHLVQKYSESACIKA